MNIEQVTAMCANDAPRLTDRAHHPYVKRTRFAVYDDYGTLVKVFRTEAEARQYVEVGS